MKRFFYELTESFRIAFTQIWANKMRSALTALGEKVIGASSLESAVKDCDLLIVGTGWPEYKDINPAWAKRSGPKMTILDLWRTLPADKFADVADVIYLGYGR